MTRIDLKEFRLIIFQTAKNVFVLKKGFKPPDDLNPFSKQKP